jgi:hypothetical protein
MSCESRGYGEASEGEEVRKRDIDSRRKKLGLEEISLASGFIRDLTALRNRYSGLINDVCEASKRDEIKKRFVPAEKGKK